MSPRALKTLLLLLVGSVAAVACGGPKGNDFGTDDGSAGEPSTGGGTAGSSQGGSAQSGSAGSTQGGSSGTGGSTQGGQGGSPEGGTSTGGSSGTSAGGTETGGTAGTDPNGGTGNSSGAGQGGSSGASGGDAGKGGDDCASIVPAAQAALQAAQVCNPATDVPICTGTVEDLCGCTVPVDNPNSEATKRYLELREPAIRCGVPCLAIVCPEPTTATCGFGPVQAIVARAYCSWLPR